MMRYMQGGCLMGISRLAFVRSQLCLYGLSTLLTPHCRHRGRISLRLSRHPNGRRSSIKRHHRLPRRQENRHAAISPGHEPLLTAAFRRAPRLLRDMGTLARSRDRECPLHQIRHRFEISVHLRASPDPKGRPVRLAILLPSSPTNTIPIAISKTT